MGEIIFDGEPPYEPLFAQTTTTKPTQDGVELVLHVFVDGPPPETVPVRILLEPEVAYGLAVKLGIDAKVVERWSKNR